VKRGKYETPMKLRMNFGEAIQRFAQTKPHEVDQVMAEGKNGRVHESDLVMPTLRLAASRKDGFIETSDLIRELTDLFNPTGRDAEMIPGRSDTFFSQKVRNLVSHKKGENNFIAQGYAEHDVKRRGIRITEAGIALLKKLGGAR
jgi:hypothetical protein